MISFGLDISDHSIEILQLGLNNKLKVFGRVILEKGIVEDGQIIQKDKLLLKIKEIIKNILDTEYSEPKTYKMIYYLKNR